MKNFLFITACLVVVQVQCQELSLGACSDYPVQVVQNFDASRYLGVWYEQSRFETSFQYNLDCVTANYSLPDAQNIIVINNGIMLSTSEVVSIEGVANFADPSLSEGKLEVKFPSSPVADYWVIGTDYDNYSVVWSCTDLQIVNIQFLWILSRTPELPKDKIAEVDDILENAKLAAFKLRETIQDRCPWNKNI